MFEPKNPIGETSVKTASLVLVLFSLSLLIACGGGGQSGGSGSTSALAPSLSSLQVTPATMSISAGATQQFTATGKFSDGSSKDMTSSVQWSSSDSTFATVNSAGAASGVAVGVVTVTAQSGSINGTAILTVTNAAANLTSITLSPLASLMPVNTTQQFTATGSYSDGSSRDLTALVSWSSSATANATIDANGLATSVAAGSTQSPPRSAAAHKAPPLRSPPRPSPP